MDTLKNLKHKRGQLKAAVTRFVTFMKSDTAQANIFQVKERKENIKNLLSDFNSLQSEIEILDEIEVDNTEREKFENNFYNALSLAETLLKVRDSNLHANKANNGNDNQQPNAQIRLPKIDLPAFYGKYEDWYPFHDTFHSLIHSNTSVSDIQKFHYLKSSVKGEAASCLESLEIKSDNYNDAWNILKERYDNKRLIVQKHIKAILELPDAPKESFRDLRYILDGVLKHMRALNSLKRPTDEWDDLIVYIITSKLDPLSAKDWEDTLTTTDMPTFKQMTDFLKKKCQTLEALIKNTKTNDIPRHVNSQKFQPKFKTSSHIITNKVKCTVCEENHPIYQCKTLSTMSVDRRWNEIKAKKLCINCLKPNHMAAQCTSGSCKICQKKHNTLLHRSLEAASTPTKFEQAPHASTTVSNHSAIRHATNQVLLSTAIVDVLDINGQVQCCRVLLDSGSQSNLISENLAKLLGLQQRKTHVTVAGVNQKSTIVTHSIEVKIRSRNSKFLTLLNCLILNKISEQIPLVPISRTNIQIPANISLADPEFNQPKNVDLLIGAELFFKLLCIGQINLGKNQPCLQKTLLGWVISGKLTVNQETARSRSICNISTCTNSDDLLVKFWELEGYSQHSKLTPDENHCEEHFIKTVKRNEEGRFIVSLPFRENAFKLGESREQALKRFYSLEKKLGKDSQLKAEYRTFIHEYLNLGHMKEIPHANDEVPHFYLPHHAVVKEKSLTTKLRVVFDGSAKTSTGVALNDVLLVGAKLQQDLFDIITRFRTFKYVLTADITKMYRQVNMHENHTPFQHILWRDNEQEAIKTFELTTVTYGTASASFLAIRALQELAAQESRNYPIGSEIILRDFYVDDLLTGTDNLAEAKQIRNQVIAILATGGFELRKWNSNAKYLLEDILNSSTENTVLDMDKSEEVNTLGLQWNSNTDVLQYSFQTQKLPSKITKRHILSSIAKIFDPLGLIGPVVMTAKVLIQKLWELKLDWDECIPMNLQCMWFEYAQNIKFINEIKIPRYIIEVHDPKYFELHGFCDASERGYGACLYLRAINEKEEISSNLLGSKSRVAPLKIISLPRLELCGALILAQLMNKVRQALNMQINKIYYWTDSKIVLNWIKAPSKAWKTFVANRVSEIHELTDGYDWHHVSTGDNPADIISRGAPPQQIIESQLWWKGPIWLQQKNNELPDFDDDISIDETPERRQLTHTVVNVEDFDLFNRYSSLSRLKRIVAYCLRFKANTISRNLGTDQHRSVSLKAAELNEAMNLLVKIAQGQAFKGELDQLERKKQLHSTSNLLSLSPFIDESGILRVGGRLKHANISEQQKHQILLPGNHPLMKLIIMHEHIRCLHAGVQSTLAAVRDKYWPVSGKTAVKSVIHKCVTCFKANPKGIEHLMGNLPSTRVTPSRPFENVGIDYFGPLHIREGRRRNSKTTKSYGAVFVCFITKAVHLELVGNLTSESFLAALRRFMGRRGKPANIYSDNGTQFVGANRELIELKEFFVSERDKEIIQTALANEGIEWHFIPPRSPHFGGIWEAAVKSAKHHLTRTLGKTSLNFEEMNTLLIQIEAILNSRPITPLSNDPNDFTFLSPSHFLIGGSFMSNAEPSLTHLKVNQLSRWQYIQQTRQHFWNRWSKEYLNQLQTRTKWKSNATQQLKPGTLTLIRDENTHPLNWQIGRVIEVFPGDDGVVRVALIKTPNGVFKRAATRLCVLPIEQ